MNTKTTDDTFPFSNIFNEHLRAVRRHRPLSIRSADTDTDTRR